MLLPPFETRPAAAPQGEVFTLQADAMLLIRLAAQNLGRRRMRALMLGLAVALAVGIGVAGLVAGRALGDGIAQSFSRMGADLVVVPRGTLVNLTASFDIDEHVEVYARVENLLDEDYYEVFAFPTDGRAAYVGARVKF